MRLIVSDIPEEGLRQETDLPIAISDSRGPDVAYVSLKILRLGKKVLVEGLVKISVSLKCSRCLKDFSYPLDVNFKDEYNPVEELSTEREQELTPKELDLSYYSNDEIDITEMIKEQVLLAVPMKPLCEATCRGICPKCGSDLNESPCNCKVEEIDPRLAPLQKFKKLMKDRKE
jgi:uncharacterized protein